MFNLLWLHDVTQAVTDTWNFHVTYGFRDYCAYKKLSPIHQFLLFELHRKIGNLLQPLTLCQQLPILVLPPIVLHLVVKLFILKERALLITANDTDVLCQRALFNNESIFLSPGRKRALLVKPEQITAWFPLGQHSSNDRPQLRDIMTYVFINDV